MGITRTAWPKHYLQAKFFSIPGEENAMKKHYKAPGQISAGDLPPDWIGK
jgi:hypothetical protein